MSLATAELPADPAALRAFALACQGELKAAQTAVQLKALEIEKLRFQIAKLRRMQFGRSSERITRQIEQLELQLEELETTSTRNRTTEIAYDKTMYRQRHRIENSFGRLKDWRRVSTRYDRCAHTFFSAICIAATVVFWLT